jgi:hypothetical protein
MEGLQEIVDHNISAPGVERQNGMPGIRYANLRLLETQSPEERGNGNENPTGQTSSRVEDSEQSTCRP